MAAASIGRRSGIATPGSGRALPVAVVTLAILLVWYLGAIWLNAPQVIDRYGDQNWTWQQLITDSWSMDRPVLPAPHQVMAELNKTVFQTAVTSKRSLVYHGWITLSATLLGFVLGTLLGILLAVGIVHVRALETSLMPWVITSQTIPILAIAPMVVVVLGSVGLTGLLPKALISMYLCFFPITIGMVKGLRSPDVLATELMHTWNATPSQVFWKLRWPAAVPFLFASLKVAIAISLVGAIVGEMPTGAQAGIGARLLSGSYYGQTVQIWAALVVGSVLAGLLIALINLAERLTLRAMGAQT
jgi:NitT/TauT family transport system permease protein